MPYEFPLALEGPRYYPKFKIGRLMALRGTNLHVQGILLAISQAKAWQRNLFIGTLGQDRIQAMRLLNIPNRDEFRPTKLSRGFDKS
jgi:hypothetical protein